MKLPPKKHTLAGHPGGRDGSLDDYERPEEIKKGNLLLSKSYIQFW